MKQIKFGDILSINEGIIVHGCNSHGIMGSGIAKQIKSKYPECFQAYSTFCAEKNNTDILGEVVKYTVHSHGILTIANAITQKNFGADGRKYVSYKAIQIAFETVAQIASITGQTVHYPLIGAGLGGGDWAIISDIIDTALGKVTGINHTLWIYE